MLCQAVHLLQPAFLKLRIFVRAKTYHPEARYEPQKFGKAWRKLPKICKKFGKSLEKAWKNLEPEAVSSA